MVVIVCLAMIVGVGLFSSVDANRSAAWGVVEVVWALVTVVSVCLAVTVGLLGRPKRLVPPHLRQGAASPSSS